MPFFERYLPQFRQPLALSDVVGQLGADSDYAAVFIPGGHGALIGLPESEAVAENAALGAAARSVCDFALSRPGGVSRITSWGESVKRLCHLRVSGCCR